MRASLLANSILALCTAVEAFQNIQNPLRSNNIRFKILCNIASFDFDSSDHIDQDSKPIYDGNRRYFFTKSFLASTSLLTILPNNAYADVSSVATYAYRSGGLPTLRPLGITKLLNRYEGFVEAPPNYKQNNILQRNLAIAFDFPSDWLQLDKLGGGIQFVDQRNGDKLYVLHATLPDGAMLKDVPKSFFGDAIFNPAGDIVRSGVVVDGYRVSRSTMLADCSSDESSGTPSVGSCLSRRRLLLKYDTVTGNGIQTVERRGLVDAYQVEGDVYMMVTSSNAVKFEAKGKERETVEAIVDSFKIG